MATEPAVAVAAAASTFDYATIPVAKDATEVDRILGGDGVDPACILTSEWRTSWIRLGVANAGSFGNIPVQVPGLIKPIAVKQRYVVLFSALRMPASSFVRSRPSAMHVVL